MTLKPPDSATGNLESTFEFSESVYFAGPDPWIDLKANGVDDTMNWKAAVIAAGSGKRIKLNGAVFHINDSDVFTGRRLEITGNASSFGTRINWTGTSRALIELGTDSGNPYDSNEYNGLDGLKMSGIEIRGIGSTALSNGVTGLTYLPSSYGIRDWRGGELMLTDVRFAGLDTGIWGIQSDINSFKDLTFVGNHRGMYFGPRSDQLRVGGTTQYIYNDTAVELDSVFDAQFKGTMFIDNGAVGINPIILRSTYSRRCQGILFEDCWFEHLIGPAVLEAYIDAGVGDTNLGDGLVLKNSMFLCNAAAVPSGHHMQYVVKLDRFDNVQIDTFTDPFGGHDNLIRKVGTIAPQVSMKVSRAQALLATTATSLAGGATASKTIRTDQGDSLVGFSDGTSGRAPIQLFVDPSFPSLKFVSAAGTSKWSVIGSITDVGQLFIDAPANGSQFHLRDHSSVDHINLHTTNGLTIGATGNKLGFYGLATPVAKPTGVAVTAAGVHAALVTLNLIAP